MSKANIEPAFRRLLTDVSAATSKIVADRVYLGAGDQNERRARIVISTISKQRENYLDGPEDTWFGTLAVTCLAGTYAEAHALADAARDVLDGYEGPAGNDYQTTIDFIRISDESDVTNSAPPGQPIVTFGVTLDADFLFHVEQ